MFDVASSEVILLGVVALLVIPPKDLPKAMRVAGHWIGKVRGVANQFRSGFDTMLRESVLQEMEKKWAAENDRIMREHPSEPVQMLPMAGPPAEAHAAEDAGNAPAVLVEQPMVAAPERSADAVAVDQPKPAAGTLL